MDVTPAGPASGHDSAKRFTRRRLLEGSALLSAAAFGLPGGWRPGGSARVRVGGVGGGGRLAGGLARLEAEHKKDAEAGKGGWLKVSPECRFTGFEAYLGVLGAPVDLVILATPPHFRPLHFEAAVKAGKHVFMEKPVAVDPCGVRGGLAAADAAKAKGLAGGAGTQRRQQAHYREILARVRAGDIGELVAAQCYWNQGDLWVKPRQEGWSDMEWQARNWLYFAWLSGDHIVEQHMHNLDVLDWAFGSPPVQCMGMGGREVRRGPEYGDIFDHFAVEYEYPNGVRALSMCRQIEGTHYRVAERLVGTRGVAFLDHGGGSIVGEKPFKPGPSPNPYVGEHADLGASIRSGDPLDEGRQVAESTLTAIMGRMSAYTGRALKRDWVLKASRLDLTPPAYSLEGELPVGPVPVPGKTPLV